METESSQVISHPRPNAKRPPPDKVVVRLAELVHKFDTGEDRKAALRNLFNHITKSFPNEALPLMSRLSNWDGSGAASFLYAKAAFQKGHVKYAHRLLEPLLNSDRADDAALILGARVRARLHDKDGAEKLLGRVSSAASQSRVIGAIRTKMSASDEKPGLGKSGKSPKKPALS